MTDASTRWRRKPIEVQAIQWRGDNTAEVYALASVANFEAIPPDDPWDDDPDATAAVRHDYQGGTWRPMYTGDWVVRDHAGKLFPVPDAVFAETYEPATDPTEG